VFEFADTVRPEGRAMMRRCPSQKTIILMCSLSILMEFQVRSTPPMLLSGDNQN
jgi:hypothetical protein